jgi:hypothetical protein
MLGKDSIGSNENTLCYFYVQITFFSSETFVPFSHTPCILPRGHTHEDKTQVDKRVQVAVASAQLNNVIMSTIQSFERRLGGVLRSFEYIPLSS